MKYLLSNFIISLAAAFIFSGCECDNPLSVDERFLEKDSLADFSAPALTIGNSSNFSFLVIADTHFGVTPYQFFKYIDDNKVSWGIDFAVILGDITEAGTQSQYDLAKSDIARTSLPVYPVIGNHDIFAGGFHIYKYVFGRTVYTFTIDTHRFIFLDTASGTLGNYQKKWLESILAQPVSGKKLIFTHLSPTDDDFQDFTEMTFPEERFFLFDLLDRHDVSNYFCGHLHLNDDREIRGVRYMIIKNASGGLGAGTLLKVNIQGGIVSASYL